MLTAELPVSPDDHRQEPRQRRLPDGRFLPLDPADLSHGYFAVHSRLRYRRGKASQYLCACGCGRQAAQWATKHGHDGSDFQADYQPMAVLCHMFYDGNLICLRRGEEVWGAKLTAARVREIRDLHADGRPFRELAAQFGVSETAIYNVVSGRTWAWVT